MMARYLVVKQSERRGEHLGEPRHIEADGPMEAVQRAWPNPPAETKVRAIVAYELVGPMVTVPVHHHLPTYDEDRIEVVDLA